MLSFNSRYLAVARLEEIASFLESGTATLDESIALFDESVALFDFCDQKLKEASQNIQRIIRLNPNKQFRKFCPLFLQMIFKTAAAELASPEISEVMLQLTAVSSKIAFCLSSVLQAEQLRLQDLDRRIRLREIIKRQQIQHSKSLRPLIKYRLNLPAELVQRF